MSRQAIDIKNRIAANLDAAMDAAELTSAELARRLGLNEKTVRRWRDGDVMPGTEKLAEAAAELDVEFDSFFLPPLDSGSKAAA
jgi:transcriptional regulator with XRE-family HTH domain